MARRTLRAVLALVVLAGACSTGGGRDEATDDPTGPQDGAVAEATDDTTSPVAPEPVLEAVDCDDPSATSERIRCSVLVLPEDPERPDERQVELAVMQIVPAADLVDPTAADAPPLVHLHGGPGGEALAEWGLWMTVADALGREVLLYDQRGSGASAPSLDCPEHTETLIATLGADDVPADRQERVAHALRDCHDRLQDAGVDLDQYDTGRSVDDLESLRLALDAEQMTLLASSYGTRLALEYVARHPGNVASMALDSVDVPGSSTAASERTAPAEAVRRLLDACAEDTSCSARHPDLASSLERALERLDADPARLAVPATDTTPATTIVVTGDELYAGVYVALYDSLVIPTLPGLVEQLAAGDESILAAVGPQVASGLVGTGVGATMSALCAEPGIDADPETDTGTGTGSPASPEHGRADTIVLASFATYCDVWPIEQRDGALTASDLSSLDQVPPTLVVAGELDPVTPADGSRQVAEVLDAHLLVVPRAGHSPMLDQRCALDALERFISDPEGDPSQAGCPPPTPFG
jgi:pimeloyl-ACP methyl ester carboxylesterase